MTVCRACEGRAFVVVDSFANAADAAISREKQAMVEKDAQEEEKRRGKLSLSAQADQMRRQFQRC